MISITAIILTKDEAIHIKRCIDNLKPIARRILVIDSYSNDGTQQIAKDAGAEVVEHKWPGNQAEQFNWALDNLSIDTEWILRLDADEYLSQELKEELKNSIPNLSPDITAIEFILGRYFLGKELKHGIVNDVKIIRMFRTGTARYEERIMDEHLSISRGETVTFKHKFYDDNRQPLSHFIRKHNEYAEREAILELSKETGKNGEANLNLSDSVEKKRAQKSFYSKLPLFWRAFAYFGYRYFLKLGFLDGKEGFLWDFLQGFWYRILVDAKIYEMRKMGTL